MKIENGKIVEATEVELFKEYLKNEWDLIMPFDEYMAKMQKCGVTIVDEQD